MTKVLLNWDGFEELERIFGTEKAMQIYGESKKCDGTYYFRYGNIVHCLSTSHCCTYTEYYVLIKPWFLNWLTDLS